MEGINLIQRDGYKMNKIPYDGEVVNAIKRKSADALPDSPAACGMKASAVKPKFWHPLVQNDVSLLGIINALISHLNENFEDVQGKQESSVTGVAFNKETRELKISFGFREGEENDAKPVCISLGNGIEKIEYSSREGLKDIYQITFLSGKTSTFTVTNGEKGEKGDTGHQFVTFYKDYGTIKEMNDAVEAQIDDGVPENGLVMIQRDDTSIDEGDATGRVYRKVFNADGTYYYKYMADLSGLVGPPGKDADEDAILKKLEEYVDETLLQGAW